MRNTGENDIIWLWRVRSPEGGSSLGRLVVKMYYFYVLQSLTDNTLYYGSTNDLVRRLDRHNKKMVRSTKSKAPYNVKYYEAYETLQLAKAREYNIKKNWAAKEELKKRI